MLPETQKNLFEAANKNPPPSQPQKKKQEQKISFFELFRFAEGIDYFLIALGIIFAMIAGCSFPWFAYLWGKILDSFLNANDANQRLEQAIYYRNIFFYLGIGSLVASWIAFASWTIVSERMAVKCRKAFMKSLLRQDVGWYDITNQFELSSNFNNDALAYQRATGEKIGSMFNLFAMFVCGAAIAIIVRWKMALVILASLPIIGGVIVLFIYLIQKRDNIFQNLYEKADTCAHQALNSIKTVKALNGQKFQQGRYAKFLNILKEKVTSWAIYAGIGTGLFFFIQYCAFSFGFWYGTHCVAGSYRCTSDTVYTPGDTTIVFFAIFVGSFNFMQLVPNVVAILDGMKAAKRLYDVIDQKSIINAPREGKQPGIRKQGILGQIVFQNVTFAYPRQKQRKVLNNINLSFEPHRSTALVGDSGCGKSTVIQLLMRFYDPDQGRVLLDGVDLKDYDLQWLRSQIGYVGQQPSLFEGTVRQNILIGKSKATDQEIRQALFDAQALQFVQKLPGGLEYNVGYAGSQLSGGQKQRIAIARALIRKPMLILLDEATSALDRRNQKLIQATLDKISVGLTTISIAHRVKTIMNADMIYVLSTGKVIEKGPFKQIQRFRQLEIKPEENKKSAGNLQKPSGEVLKYGQEDDMMLANKIPASQGQDASQMKEAQNQGSVFGRLFSYTEGHRLQFFLGIICCIIAGAVHPGSALLLANVLNQQFNLYPYAKINPSDPNVATGIQNAEKYILALFGLAIFIFFPFLAQSALFTIVGQSMTQKIRSQVYSKLLKLPVKWFQKKENRGGAAASRFGVDSRYVNSLVTSLISTLTMNLTSILVGMIFAFIFVWQLGLVGIVAMPAMVAGGFISMLFYGGFGDLNKKYYENASKLSEQAILNIRTVYSCNYQTRLGQIYDELLQYPLDSALEKGTKLGLLYGFSQLILQFTFGVLFYFATLVMRDNPDVSLINIFYAIMSITWAGWYAGNNFYFMPDVLSGKESARNLFKILDIQDQDQKQIRTGSKILTTPIQGNLQLKRLSFRYSKKSDPILYGLNLRIKKGQKIAFVGPSGCGKSTLIQLLQRYYDYEGQIFLDGVQIRDYDIHHLRASIATVNQQPSLFTGSIAENIKYNINVTQQQLKAAAQKAEILQFVEADQKKFDRDVGVLGSQLSGGQKQRLAIARAIIRQPQLLMLDQATSALDRNTEKKVQHNIDQIMGNKTSLVVAHRIQTIMNADRIYLFDKGQILEQGTYNELIQKKGYFYNLQKGEKLYA